MTWLLWARFGLLAALVGTALLILLFAWKVRT
jgi:hypothetical protein